MSQPLNIFCPASKQEWRGWLAQNHQLEKTIWLVCSKKNAASPTVTHGDAVAEALCYGWIDGTARSLDGERFLQSFTPRRPKSVWCKANKEKAGQLINNGLMTKAGLDSIKVAKSNGYWSILDEVEQLIIPKDLGAAFRKTPGSKGRFLSQSRSEKKRLLQWLVLAKRPETRQQRINAICNPLPSLAA